MIETQSGIILPGHPFFEDYLYAAFPPDWRNFAYHNPDFAFIVRPGGHGLLEAVTHAEAENYIEDGEFDARCEEMEYDDLIYA
ncbi:hypothetical protein NIES2101_23960 [Calothrix sp. HK-06]|nr:hypothetical protein NIES2101_23825 [Calothrix sp. HK-06]OKH47323.1 hypothetical protein NIES2101_23960 [Calothrix sp. HK-06]